jgi:hypothetical protein
MISILALILSLTTLTARAQNNAPEPLPTSDKYTYQQPEIPNHFNSKMDEYNRRMEGEIYQNLKFRNSLFERKGEIGREGNKDL